MANSRYDEFKNFRAAIVRAVAISWHDRTFAEVFRSDPFAAMKKWFGYDCPYALKMNVKLSNENKNPHHFMPVETGGWVGTNNTIRLYLPPRPKDPAQRAEALAAYNQAYTLFLSDNESARGH